MIAWNVISSILVWISYNILTARLGSDFLIASLNNDKAAYDALVAKNSPDMYYYIAVFLFIFFPNIIVGLRNLMYWIDKRSPKVKRKRYYLF